MFTKSCYPKQTLVLHQKERIQVLTLNHQLKLTLHKQWVMYGLESLRPTCFVRSALPHEDTRESVNSPSPTSLSTPHAKKGCPYLERYGVTYSPYRLTCSTVIRRLSLFSYNRLFLCYVLQANQICKVSISFTYFCVLDLVH